MSGAEVVSVEPFSIGKFEEIYYGKSDFSPLVKRDVLVDLSKTSFIDSAAMLYLLALMSERNRKNLRTFLQLPTNKQVLDFLQIWRFPQAFEAAVRKRLSDITVGDNRDYFDHAPADVDTRYAGSTVPATATRERLLSNYYFEIHTFRQQLELFGASFALTEAAKWRHVGSVLRNLLRAPENLFASRIVYEALVNAVRHPKASVIQMVSFMKWHERGRSGDFTLSIWDDGITIAETLNRVLDRGRSILPPGDTPLLATYDLTINRRGDRTRRVVTSQEIPRKGAGELDLLLGSTFPGTTSDTLSARSVPADLGDERSEEQLRPGMGLYLLVNAAIAVYGGSVRVRSGHWRLDLKPGEGGAHYKADMFSLEDWPSFRGNLITVRLPLQLRQEAETLP